MSSVLVKSQSYGGTGYTVGIRMRRQSRQETAEVLPLVFGPLNVRFVISHHVLLQPYDTASAFIKRPER